MGPGPPKRQDADVHTHLVCTIIDQHGLYKLHFIMKKIPIETEKLESLMINIIEQISHRVAVITYVAAGTMLPPGQMATINVHRIVFLIQ